MLTDERKRFEEWGSKEYGPAWVLAAREGLWAAWQAALAAREQEPPIAWVTPTGLCALSSVEKNYLTDPDRRKRSGEFESAARDAERYSVPCYAHPAPAREPVADVDRKWVTAMRDAFADPASDVNLPPDYFRRLCDIALRDPAPARSQETRGVAWLIETTTGQYWCGGKCGWIPSPNLACRFSRAQDAQCAREWLRIAPDDVRVTEHVWLDAAPAEGGGEGSTDGAGNPLPSSGRP